MEVSVRNNTTEETTSVSVMFTLEAIKVGSEPVVTPSANPLVYIYSAPACREGRVRVQFQSAGGSMQSTPSKPCVPGHSTSFYLAGMLPAAPCTAQYIFETEAGAVNGASVTFTPPASTLGPPPVSLLTKGQPPAVDGFLLQSLLSGSAIATDLAGNIVWSGPSDISELTRPQTGGTFLGIYENDAEDPSYQFFREFDMAGITIAETNAAQVSQQLALLGVHAINAFHHEARKLPNGNYLVLASSERILTNVQGPGPVDVIGDTILVLNRGSASALVLGFVRSPGYHPSSHPGRDLRRRQCGLCAVVFGPGCQRLAARECAATHAGRQYPVFHAQSGLGDQDRLREWSRNRRRTVASGKCRRLPNRFIRPQSLVLPPARCELRVRQCVLPGL